MRISAVTTLESIPEPGGGSTQAHYSEVTGYEMWLVDGMVAIWQKRDKAIPPRYVPAGNIRWFTPTGVCQPPEELDYENRPILPPTGEPRRGPGRPKNAFPIVKLEPDE